MAVLLGRWLYCLAGVAILLGWGGRAGLAILLGRWLYCRAGVAILLGRWLYCWAGVAILLSRCGNAAGQGWQYCCNAQLLGFSGVLCKPWCCLNTGRDFLYITHSQPEVHHKADQSLAVEEHLMVGKEVHIISR